MTASIDWGHPGFVLVNLVEAFGVDSTGVADAGAQINTATAKLRALNASGQIPFIPTGTYNLTTAVSWVPGGFQISEEAVFTGANVTSCPPVPKVMFLGDSNTLGTDVSHQGMTGGYATSAVQYLRTLRSDFDVIGSVIATPEQAALSSLPYNEGHSGATLASTAAAYAGYCATTGVGNPDLVVLMLGTADIEAGRTLVQMQADALTLYTDILAVNPSTIVVWMPPPVFVAGTVVAGSLAAWNALQALFATWLQGTFIPSLANAIYCGASRLVGQGDIQTDGIHLGQGGQGAVGTGVARQLHGLMGAPNKDVLPRVFNTRQPWYSIFSGGNGLADDIALVAHPGFNPGAGSLTLAFDYCPTTMLNSGALSVAVYGANGANNYYEIFVSSNPAVAGGLDFSVYWMTAGATILAGTNTTFGGSPGAVIGAWHRIVLMADAATGTIGLYINGQLAGLAQGHAAWTSTQQTFRLGGDNGFANGAPGHFGRLYAATAIPGRPGSMAALLAVEEDYYLGRSLVPGQGTASYSMDNVLTDDVYAPGAPNPSLILQGAAAFVAGYPSGTPARPWEYQATHPAPAMPSCVPITTPTTGTMTLTDTQATAQIIPIALTLTGDVTVVMKRPGTYYFDISAVVYAAHNLFFKYGTATSPAISALSLSADLAVVVAGAQGPNTIAVNF